MQTQIKSTTERIKSLNKSSYDVSQTLLSLYTVMHKYDKDMNMYLNHVNMHNFGIKALVKNEHLLKKFKYSNANWDYLKKIGAELNDDAGKHKYINNYYITI